MPVKNIRKLLQYYKQVVLENKFQPLIQYVNECIKKGSAKLNEKISANEATLLQLLLQIDSSMYNQLDHNEFLNIVARLFTVAAANQHDKNKNNLLHSAVLGGNPELVSLLFSWLSKTEYTELLNEKNSSGNSPLAIASHQKNTIIENMLLEKMHYRIGDIVIEKGKSVKEAQRKLKADLIAKGSISPFSDRNSSSSYLPNAAALIEKQMYVESNALIKPLQGRIYSAFQYPLLQPLINVMALATLGQHRIFEQTKLNAATVNDRFTAEELALLAMLDELPDEEGSSKKNTTSNNKPKHLKILFPEKISALKLLGAENNLGLYTHKNSIFIATSDPSGTLPADEIFSTMMHEATHFVCKVVFNNAGTPFNTLQSPESVAMAVQYHEVMKATENRINILSYFFSHITKLKDDGVELNSQLEDNQSDSALGKDESLPATSPAIMKKTSSTAKRKINDPVILTDEEMLTGYSIVLNVQIYPQDEQFREYIVRVPEIITRLGYIKGYAFLDNNFPELLDYYEKWLNPELEKYLRALNLDQYIDNSRLEMHTKPIEHIAKKAVPEKGMQEVGIFSGNKAQEGSDTTTPPLVPPTNAKNKL